MEECEVGSRPLDERLPDAALSTAEIERDLYQISGLQNAPSPSNPAARLVQNDFLTPKVAPPTYAVELAIGGFDLYILAALAMDEAHSLNPTTFAPDIAGLAAGQSNPGRTVVYTYERGGQALSQGKKIAYWGAGGPFGWNSQHVPVPGYSITRLSVTPSGLNAGAAVVTMTPAPVEPRP
jgi:hypothetical protein